MSHGQQPPRRPTGYRSVIEEQPRVEFEQTPSTGPQGVQFRGNGWKVNIPLAVVIAVVSGVGVKYFPAQNQAEADSRAEARLEALRNAEFRQEMRAANQSTQERIGRLEDEFRTYRAVLDERLKRLETK